MKSKIYTAGYRRTTKPTEGTILSDINSTDYERKLKTCFRFYHRTNYLRNYVCLKFSGAKYNDSMSFYVLHHIFEKKSGKKSKHRRFVYCVTSMYLYNYTLTSSSNPSVIIDVVWRLYSRYCT